MFFICIQNKALAINNDNADIQQIKYARGAWNTQLVQLMGVRVFEQMAEWYVQRCSEAVNG